MRESAKGPGPEGATVVIPARDAAAILPATLAALEGADVVVVDNGSSDGTAEVARRHGATVVVEPQRSRARARNAGARATQADVLAFLDADCVPCDGWLEALNGAVQAGADLAGGPVEWRTSHAPNKVERFDAQWRLTPEKTTREGWTGSGNLAIRRSVFEALNGFDPRFSHGGEDVDLCRRAPTAPVFVAQAVVTHAAERSVKGMLARGFRHGHANVQLDGRRYWRHPKPLVAGDWALERFEIEDRELLGIARLDYGARMLGSLWADVRR